MRIAEVLTESSEDLNDLEFGRKFEILCQDIYQAN